MAVTIFPSSKGWVSALAIWGTIVLVVGILMVEVQGPMPLLGKLGLGLFTFLVCGLLAWIWFATFYRIAEGVLYFRSGPIHGSIPIQQIKAVKLNHHLWSGIRPALDLRGMVIQYNKWDEIYLSPADKEPFLEALRQVNPAIVVE
ncbi:PH domain-containing protein [Rufibacter psychrotolerans]|uniref:PH domain-containing protein n=1 Tax=Rufibacter psychrotolerans TaxID=2812556 RepID=UPI0019689935|nr:PH domain-containing protein [Rufibacter sp. SYSU D00308]